MIPEDSQKTAAQIGGIIRAITAGLGAVAMAAGVAVPTEQMNEAAAGATTGVGSLVFLGTVVWSIISKLRK